ncbi:hypothetical protein ACLKA6_010829 [Drosophila palustris]
MLQLTTGANCGVTFCGNNVGKKEHQQEQQQQQLGEQGEQQQDLSHSSTDTEPLSPLHAHVAGGRRRHREKHYCNNLAASVASTGWDSTQLPLHSAQFQLQMELHFLSARVGDSWRSLLSGLHSADK